MATVPPAPRMSQEQCKQLTTQLNEYVKIVEKLEQKRVANEAASRILEGQRRDAEMRMAGKSCSRWSPTPEQLQRLEARFIGGGGMTPSKPAIKEFADVLIEFGPITETNVYNWFQNRKVRDKKNRLKAQQEAQAAKNGPQVPAAEMMVTVNNKLWKVPGGMLDVKTTFGAGVTLIDSYGRPVPVDKKGIVMYAIVHKAIYTTSPAPTP